MENKLMRFLKGDQVIWIILIILSLFSLLIVYSSTGTLAYRKAGGNTFYFIVKHFMMLGFGFVIMWVIVEYVPVKYFSAVSPFLLGISLVLLLFSIAFSRGSDASGRTINLGPLSFQPAELAKISLILFVSRLLGNSQTNDSRPGRKTFLWIIGASGIICGAITLVNFSTAALLFGTIMVMMFIGRIPNRFLLGTVMAGMLWWWRSFLLLPTRILGVLKPFVGESSALLAAIRTKR
jgi:cell division protein FtsW